MRSTTNANSSKKKRQQVAKNENKGMQQLYAFGKKSKIDLSLSENPLGCSPLVSYAIKSMTFDCSEYPKPNGFLLKEKLAVQFDLEEDNFFIASGSESIICALPQLCSGNNPEVVVPQLTFPMLSLSAELAGVIVKKIQMTTSLGIDLEKIKRSITINTQMIFICNPNNPTGGVLSKKAMKSFLNKIPKSIVVVIDEANIEFGGKTMISEVENSSNLIVLRTFSKGFGLANLRVGFACASKEIITSLEQNNQPFPISGLSEELAIVALGDTEFIETTKKFVAVQRARMKAALEQLGFRVFPSDANNLFVQLPSSLSKENFVQKLEEAEISVVLGSNFPGFDDGFFRLSIRDEGTNERFLEFVKGLGS